MTKPSWGDFWSLNREAHTSGEKIDYYDLHSDGHPVHLRQWKRLLTERNAAVKKLVEYVIEHQGELLAAITDEDWETKKEDPELPAERQQ